MLKVWYKWFLLENIFRQLLEAPDLICPWILPSKLWINFKQPMLIHPRKLFVFLVVILIIIHQSLIRILNYLQLFLKAGLWNNHSFLSLLMNVGIIRHQFPSNKVIIKTRLIEWVVNGVFLWHLLLNSNLPQKMEQAHKKREIFAVGLRKQKV